MAFQRPVVQSLAIDPFALPESLEDLTDPGTQVVVVLADTDVRESGWAPRATLELARGLAERGRRVLVMDGDVVEPTLHHILGVGSGEGVTDAILFGVSPERIAQATNQGFQLAPAGTVVANPSAVLGHPRWPALLSRCRDLGFLILLYLRSDLPEDHDPVAGADRILRLKSIHHPTDDPALSGVVLHPTASPGAEAPAPEDREESPEPGASTPPEAPRETEPPPEPETLVESGATQPPQGTSGSPSDAPPPAVATPTAPAARSETPGSRTLLWFLMILLVAVLGMLGAAFLGYVDIPGITPTVEGTSPPAHELARSP